MFRVNRPENRLHKLDQKRFAELQLRERDHLQEWLAHQPDALGEDLLIIQKEFNGFEDTLERLDLLALDKEGRLVVIENKLDDSGRDVAWQALKYTAYCSSLTKAQILDIYQRYLDRWCGGGSAASLICEFLEEDDIEEVVLNPGNDQRMIFVAANFRKEVTTTVLWLISRGIDARCYRVTPYTLGEELLLDLRQIIPTPEAAEFMIGMSSKENDERTTERREKRRHKIRREFWQMALETLRARGLTRYQNVGPTDDHWISTGTGMSGCVYNLIFLQDEARVELSLQRSSTEENKRLFDRLVAQRQAIEERFGANLDWHRMENRKSSKVTYGHPFDGHNPESWPAMIDWLAIHIQKLEQTCSGPLGKLNQELRGLARGAGDVGA